MLKLLNIIFVVLFLSSHEGPRENPNFRPSYLEEFRNFAFQQLNIDPSKVSNLEICLTF